MAVVNGAALRAIRERSGLSVRDVIARLQEERGITVHEDHLRNVETGARQAGPQLTRALARVLRVPQTAILAEIAEPRAHCRTAGCECRAGQSAARP